MSREVSFEGYSEEEILNLPEDLVKSIILTGEPIVFRAGTATLLGEFHSSDTRLRIELAQIEGGGEGVLLALGGLARRFARLHGISEIEWIVHAVHCAKPNLKLRRVLEKRGFTVQNVAGADAYRLLEKS